MTELLIALNKSIWVIDFLALCIFAFISLKKQQVNSSTIALASAVLLSVIIGNYEILVKSLVIPDGLTALPYSWLLIFIIFNCGLAFFAFAGYKVFRDKSLPWKILYVIRGYVSYNQNRNGSNPGKILQYISF